MRRFLLFVSSFLLALGSPGTILPAVDFFVSGTGSDANGGLSAGDAFRTITKAMTLAGSGDRVIVAAGSYDAGAGEVFPIALSPGVSLEGPGDGSAVVDGTTATGPVFTLAPNGSTTAVSGLDINAHTTSGSGIRVTGIGLADLQVINNRIMASRFGILDPGGPAGNLLVSSNTLQVSGLFALDGICWDFGGSAGVSASVVRNTLLSDGSGSDGVHLDMSTSADVDVLLSGNLISGWGSDGVDVSASLGGWSSGAALDMVFASNQVLGNGDAGIEICLSQDGGDSTLLTTLQMINNLLQGNSDEGHDLSCFASGSPGLVQVSALYQSNEARSNGSDGMLLEFSAEDNGAAVSFTGTFSCNVIASNIDDGLDIHVSDCTGMLAFSGLLRFNEFVNNGDTGLEIEITNTDTSNSLSFTAVAYGNTIRGNFNNGVILSTTLSPGIPQIFDIDFGSPALPGGVGRNTIVGNQTSGGGTSEFVLLLTSTAAPVPAAGNWWTTADPEDVIFHSVDSAPNGTVDFSMPLADPLLFSAVFPPPGGTVTVTAGTDTYFVHKAGKTPIEVTLNGIPGANVVVAPDGSSLSFTMPAVGGTSLTLFIRNPGGQTGTLIRALKLVSRCFVATAAYGDEEAPEVRLLRRWRNESLAGNPLGRLAVKAYYALSPPLAESIAGRPWARAASRAALTPVVGAVRLWLEARWLYGLAGAALLLRFLLRRR